MNHATFAAILPKSISRSVRVLISTTLADDARLAVYDADIEYLEAMDDSRVAAAQRDAQMHAILEPWLQR
jgi:hypothetical protein